MKINKQALYNCKVCGTVSDVYNCIRPDGVKIMCLKCGATTERKPNIKDAIIAWNRMQEGN